MKKTLLFAILLFVGICQSAAQNIQLHYDFGHSLYDEFKDSRAKITTTVEMFKPDKWGSTFFFVDMDYADNEVKSAYWEIARELKFWDGPLSIHAEYNGGLNYIKDSWLAGLTYTYNNSDFTKGFSFTPMYKYICSNPTPNNFQLTGTWYIHFGKGKYSFTGFADFWRELRPWQGTEFIFMTEPQLWVNLRNIKGWEKVNLSLGTEVELTCNFVGKGFHAMPTVAAKWTF